MNLFTANTNPDDVQSTLSSDGVLTITANRKPIKQPDQERVVPITQTGPSKPSEVTNVPVTQASTPADNATPKVE